MNRKNLVLWIIAAVVLVGVLAGAAVLYPRLAGRLEPEAPAASAPAEEQEEELPKAPDFTVEDGNGETLHLSDLRGRPVVVNFWATWCPYCVEELPLFQQAYETYGDRVQFLMVDLADGHRETKEMAEAYAEQYGYTFPIGYDVTSSAVLAYGLSSIPRTVAVNSKGELVFAYTGAMTEEAVTQLLEALAGE